MTDRFLRWSFVALAASRVAALLARNVSDLFRGFVTASHPFRGYFTRFFVTASFTTAF